MQLNKVAKNTMTDDTFTEVKFILWGSMGIGLKNNAKCLVILKVFGKG